MDSKFLAEMAKLKEEAAAKAANKAEKVKKPRAPPQSRAGPRADLREELKAAKAQQQGQPVVVAHAPQQPAPAAAQPPKVVPVAMKIRVVLDFLRKNPGEKDFRQIEEGVADKGAASVRNLADDEELLSELRSNENILFTSHNRLRYYSKVDIADKFQLLKYFRDHPTGVLVSDVRDAYPEAERDAKSWREDGKLYVIFNYEKQQDVYYPVEEGAAPHVDRDVVATFLATAVPPELPELQAELRAAALRSATEARLQRALRGEDRFRLEEEAPKKRKARAWRTEHVTNKHLPGLFATAGTVTIDQLPPAPGAPGSSGH